MKRRLIAFLLSLGTCVGGHFYNGRWARATFFAALLFLVLAVAALLLVFGIFDFSAREFLDYYDALETLGQMKTFTTVLTVAVGTLWLLSAVTAALDASATREEEQPEAPWVRRLAVMAMCGFGLLVVLANPLVWYVCRKKLFSEKEPPETATQSPPALSRQWRSIPGRPTIVTEAPPLPPADYSPLGFSPVGLPPASASLPSAPPFFGALDSWGSLPRAYTQPLGPGDGAIQGRVLLNGEPLAGLGFQFYLRPNWETEWALSDEKGNYTIAIPPGEYSLVGWHLNLATAFDLLGDKMPKPGHAPFSEATTLTVTADSPAAGPDFEFVDPVVCVHPGDGAVVTTDTLFQWEAYPGAAYYRLDLEHHTWFLVAITTHLTPAREHRFEGTTATAALAGITLARGLRHSWGVEAYNSSGTLLSKTAESKRPQFRVR